MTSLVWASDHPAQAAKIVLEDPPTTNGRGDVPMLEGWLALSSGTVEEADAIYREQFPEWTEEERYRRAISITSTAPAFSRISSMSARPAVMTTGSNLLRASNRRS